MPRLYVTFVFNDTYIMYRFLNDRREKVRNENSSLTFTEITKLLASEWSKLPSDQKQVCTFFVIFFYLHLYNILIKLYLQQYLEAAEQDKERYNREFSNYKQTEAYRLFNEKQSERQNENKKERNGTDVNVENV